jgi:hypothetical protein
MKKENENIHLLIIEQEYKRNKTKQNDNESFSRKAEMPVLTKQNDASVIQKLKQMHPNFAVIEELESLQTTEEPDKENSPQVEEPPCAPEVSGLLDSLQKMRTEEQKLLEIKQALLKKQQDLQSKLVEEIGKKKMAIDELKAEIPTLESWCKQVAQALGIPF